jgi:hypothetical protein
VFGLFTSCSVQPLARNIEFGDVNLKIGIKMDICVEGAVFISSAAFTSAAVTNY